MGFKLREIEAESKFCRELTLEAIERAVPVAEVQAVLAETGVCAQRERKLNMLVTVFVTIAMNIYSRASIGEVMRKIAQGLRYIWPDPDYPVRQRQRHFAAALPVGGPARWSPCSIGSAGRWRRPRRRAPSCSACA